MIVIVLESLREGPIIGSKIGYGGPLHVALLATQYLIFEAAQAIFDRVTFFAGWSFPVTPKVKFWDVSSLWSFCSWWFFRWIELEVGYTTDIIFQSFESLLPFICWEGHFDTIFQAIA
jgi:hypothetical protein